MGYIASAFKAGNLIRAKKLDILCTRAQEQLGKDQTLIHILLFFVCLFFSFQKQLPVKRRRLSNTS